MDQRRELPIGGGGEEEQCKNKVFTHLATLTHLQTASLYDFARVCVCARVCVECVCNLGVCFFFFWGGWAFFRLVTIYSVKTPFEKLLLLPFGHLHPWIANSKAGLREVKKLAHVFTVSQEEKEDSDPEPCRFQNFNLFLTLKKVNSFQKVIGDFAIYKHSPKFESNTCLFVK